MNINLIHSLSYKEILEHATLYYIKEFGERKFKVVYKKIMTSNRISGLISTVKYKGLAPGSKDFIFCINEIPYFLFPRGQTQAMAALIALERWNEEVNSKQLLLDEQGLRLRAINIIEESKAIFY